MAGRTFTSVSAFDFIEHIPRLLPTADGRDTTFPFINLMNEVRRVLDHGGRFHAVTPAFPYPHAFTDPTHVNFITHKTHEYFCGDKPARCTASSVASGRCGSNGCTPEAYSAVSRPRKSLARRLAGGLQAFLRKLRGKASHAYVLWELEAIK
ncbi:hypothetical protein ACFPOA_00835 [Lysobacter niabensis]|uniref:hypothetical protein n=1 Tax=Agrilutibacter niabensis TaxID=380628 RepID=UPI003610B14D